MRGLKLVFIPSICLVAVSVGACQGTASSDAPAVAANVAPVTPAIEFREVTVPAGTTLNVALDDTVGSATSRVDEPVRAHLTRPVTVDSFVALPEGSELSGAVVEALRSAKVKGRARVAIRFDAVRAPEGGETYPIRTPAIAREAEGTKKKDAMKIGIPAAAGAVLGGIFGGGKGAAIGAGVGGGAGTAVVLSTRGEEVSIGRGAALTVSLEDPVKVRVRTSPAAVPVAAN
jgi:hypothetical protein